MDIQGGYAKPKVWDILLIQIIILPYTLYQWTRFYSRWLWKFGICREEYGEDEKLYVIRRNMKLSEGQFNVSISYRWQNRKLRAIHVSPDIYNSTPHYLNLTLFSADIIRRRKRRLLRARTLDKRKLWRKFLLDCYKIIGCFLFRLQSIQ